FINQDFKPVKTKSHEIYLGIKIDNTPCFLDLRCDPHLLIAGKTRAGKSYLFANLITNLFYYNSKQWDVFLLQVMKGEIDVYKDCPSVKFASDNEEHIEAALNHITKKIHERSKFFAQHGIKNLDHWNKHFPKKTMKRILIAAEEISFFMQEDSKIFKHLTGVVKAGASAGVHFIGITQRTTIANLPSELKAQMTVATTKQRSALDSNNAIDIKDAVSLERQEFIVSNNDGYIFFKVPNIDEDFKILNKYVSQIKTPNININFNQKNKNNSKTPEVAIDKVPIAQKKSTPLQAKKEETKVDNRTLIFKFIEEHGAITLNQAIRMYKINKSTLYSLFRRLEQKGEIKAYKDERGKDKVYYSDTIKNAHSMLKIEFYTILVSQGYTILEYTKEKSLLNGIIRCDGYYKVKKDNKIFTLILEIDYTHFTEEAKFNLYEKVYEEEEFILILVREKIGARIRKKYKILATDFTFQTIGLLPHF
ncbi:MAG: FtsK/SpoIIIE domain-containing protein, partial [Sarcina sp.]